jgi:hypothetical protein
MNRFMKLLKNGRLAKMCKLAALIIALIGTAQVALQLYNIWMVYQASQPGQNGSSLIIVSYEYLIPNIASTLQNIAGIIFYVIVLYVAGNVINVLFVSTQDEVTTHKDDETGITYEPLDDATIIESLDKRR